MEKKRFKKKFIAYNWLKENITVNPLKDGLILLNSVDNDPEFATLLVNSYLEVIDSFYKQNEIFIARNYRKYLECREKELYVIMNAYLDSLKSFQKRENLEELPSGHWDMRGIIKRSLMLLKKRLKLIDIFW